jgi:hypothetical protein
MPLPGGPADKLGNRYELWWTVWQLVRMLDGKADSIRIEDPGVTKAEFVISHGGRRELHQAKRSHPDGKWSLASLAGSDMRLLQAVHAQLAGNDDRFVFVSSSDARELAELTERSRQAASLQEFKEKFLAAKEVKGHLEKLQKYWSNANIATALDILRRIEVRAMDEQGVEENVTWGLRALVLTNPISVCNELHALAEDSVHKTITHDELVHYLAIRGYRLRRLRKPEATSDLVHEVTEQYLAGVRKKLIRKTLLPREATQELLSRIAENARGGDVVLTGKAGVGKTGCVIEFVEALRGQGIPVLAVRLDRLSSVSSTHEFGQQLGLEESPALVLAAAAEEREAVLVVDQLDAVSTISGRSSDFLEAVEGILVEARGIRGRVKLHVVVVCRAFDWENDHRLRRMLSNNHAQVEVTELSLEEVRNVLSADHFPVELFSPRQLELLRLPQNLSLFLDAGFGPTTAPTFYTAKELFDRYWDAKRLAVTLRAAPLPDQWTEVVNLLCDEMARTQQLSVPREKLDRFELFVQQMASEGVLAFERLRYSFAHESFFDYCFARGFVASDADLTTFLTAAEQHLFRRAQLRQVLAYLRDLDRVRYCAEVRALLSDSRIRMHLKDLTLALLATGPDPSDGEWELLEPWLQSVWAAFVRGEQSPDKFASLVWHHIFGSKSWFHLIDRLGIVARWLASGNNNLTDMAVNYLCFHQRHAGDRVAELLEPYEGQGGEWQERLRYIMEWADHIHSRRFFELFLQLIDDGTLDEARDRFAMNGTFWSLLYGLAKARPDWIPEVSAHWLRRRLAIVQQAQSDGEEIQWGHLFNDDHFGSEPLSEAAEKHPALFVQHVLPAVLDISDAALDSNAAEPPRRDAVWPRTFGGDHLSMDAACLHATVTALEKLVQDQPGFARGHIATLKPRASFTANYLLLSLYAAAAESFADEAVDLLCGQPWRLNCGYSDSPYWVAMELIRQTAPACAPENLARLEGILLTYSSDYEKTPHGHRDAGHACFTLLSAVPEHLRSKNAQARFRELERKFGKPDPMPQDFQSYSIGSPIKQEAGEKMSDEQWLRAIAKYRADERLNYWDYPEKGGAWELAGMLRDFVHNEPERFARLSLRFPIATHPAYIDRVLDGLKGTAAPTVLKLDVCRKAFAESRVACGTVIADLLGGIEEPLPQDAVEMLHWLATRHPQPERELWEEQAPGGQSNHRRDILTHGINTTRGRAAEAIRNLILRDASYVAQFRETLDQLVGDRSLGVRSCVASTLLAVALHDSPLALELFATLAVADDRLLATLYAERFIYYRLRENFFVLRPLVERMLRSFDSDVSRAGARLACLAALDHPTAADLADEAMHGDASQRCGVAEVAAANIARADCRAWCQPRLVHLCHDHDANVRRQVASCFRRLAQAPLEEYEALIVAFCESPAYQEDSFAILHVLEESVRRLPGITCWVCEKFLIRFSDEAKDIRTHRAGDIRMVVKLLFRTYHQHQRDQWAPRCLDLIDRMCSEGIQDVSKGLEEFER